MSENNVLQSPDTSEDNSGWEAIGEMGPSKSEIVKFVKTTRNIPDGSEALKTIAGGISNKTNATNISSESFMDNSKTK